MQFPLISIVIPVYNGERYLLETLESVFLQTYAPFEVIVVDDGSTDASASIAQSFSRVRYVHQQNSGNAAARNTGIDAAKGSLIAFIDQDDLWLPDKLRRHMMYMAAKPQVCYTLARFEYFLEPGIQKPAWCRDELLAGSHIDYSPGSLMARKSVFEIIGRFNTDFTSGNDSDWFFRANDKKIPMAVLPNVLLRRRIHKLNQSAEVSRSHKELLTLVRQSINRKTKI